MKGKNDLFVVHPRAYSKVYNIYIFIFSLSIIALFISTLNYCLSTYTLKSLEENDPNIDLSGISDFSFDYYLSSYDREYSPDISNLGYTGKLFFDCYEGKCKYSKPYSCQREICTKIDEEEEECHYEDMTCYEYTTQTEYPSSHYCRKTNGNYCDRCEGYSGGNIYSYSSCSCSRNDNSKSYSKPKSCSPYNIILNWKKYYFNRINVTYFGRFNYLNSAVPANESCPEDKHQCGILDELGNKLCYPTYLSCPINYITLNKSEMNYSDFFSYTIDNKTLYYTKKAIYNGRVLGGFFVDSDLMIKYNLGDCQIISTGTISELLKNHENILYKDSLKFNPYKDKNIDKKGKAYLKWCIPGVGKQKKISLIKDLLVDYDFNLTSNKAIEPIKELFKISYFVCLPGHLGLIIILILFLLAFKYPNNINPFFICQCIICRNKKSRPILFFLILFILILLIGSCLSITNNKNISAANEMNLNQNVIIVIYILNIISFCINCLLIIFIILFLCYLSKARKYKDDIFKLDNNYRALKNIDKKKEEAKYDNNPDFKAYKENLNETPSPLTPDGIY